MGGTFFDPEQYDEILPGEECSRIELVERTIDNEMQICQDQYKETKALLEVEINKKPRNTNKIKSLREKMINHDSEYIIKEYEKKRIKIFHKSNSIYAIKIEGETDNERTWKYKAVYKADDGNYYEALMPIQWLQENFEQSYLDALKEQKKFGSYLIHNDSELQFVQKFPIQDYIKDKTHKFNEALWEYKISEESMKIWSLRAVVTFDRKSTKNNAVTSTDDNEPKDPMDVTIITNFSVCFQKPVPTSSLNKRTNIYSKAEYKDMTEIFSLIKIYNFRGDVANWWANDHMLISGEGRNKNLFYYEDPNRYYDYNDKDQFFELIASNDKKKVVDCIKSPLGKLKTPQVYYWKFTANDQYDWNQTKTQISMMKWDIAQEAFIGKEWDPNLEKKNNIVLRSDWIDKNFPGLGTKLKEFATIATVPRFFEVPLANGRLPDINSNNFDNPIIRYHQTDKKSCCFYSLCSAFDYLLLIEEGKRLRKFRDLFLKKYYYDNFFQIDYFIINHISRIKAYLNIQKNYIINKIEENYEILDNNVGSYDIRLVVLAGYDGSENHAVCIVDKYIFDSNCKNALDFNIEGLNECCSGSDFHHIVRGYHFQKLII